eukprot:2989387-Prymnesium_polylepis.1
MLRLPSDVVPVDPSVLLGRERDAHHELVEDAEGANHTWAWWRGGRSVERDGRGEGEGRVGSFVKAASVALQRDAAVQ